MSENKFFHIGTYGIKNVGVSSILRQFYSNVFLGDYSMPLLDFYRKEIFVDNNKISLEINEKDNIDILMKASIPRFDGYLLVYSVDDKESFLKITDFYNLIIENKKRLEIPILLVGNKCDLNGPERKVSKQEGEELASNLKIDFLEVSAKTNENIQEIFINLARQEMKIQSKMNKNNKAAKTENEKCRI